MLKTEAKLTMQKIKIMTVFGTRPEAIKMAPLINELNKRPEFLSICCLTAQHREMLDTVMNIFDIKADYDLDIMEPGQNLYTITTKALCGLGKVMAAERPDMVLVHGDTTTTFSGALSAFYERIKVGHVEAGLRSGDIYSPYPEEINRKLTSQIACMHFAPTGLNAQNLSAEGVRDGVFVTGNTVIDAMKYTVNANNSFPSKTFDDIDFKKSRVITLTCHRRENYGKPMENIFYAVRDLAQSFRDVEIVYPVHPSPTVQTLAKSILGAVPRVHLTEPLDTINMHKLISKSFFVMTDSGGIQEEAPALGKPVLVLRRETERPEAIEAGTVKLAGVERDRIFELGRTLLTEKSEYLKMSNAVNPYGDGNASSRIADAILYHFGINKTPPDEFLPVSDTIPK